ncbi:MAG: hypothetical protein VX107_17490 [Pseudomonadota bacterium]|nr:hypothetical protein [Pseudomonadota bacterium]
MNKNQYTGLGLFELFLTSNVGQEYAETFRDAEQIDDTDISQYMRAAGNTD